MVEQIQGYLNPCYISMLHHTPWQRHEGHRRCDLSAPELSAPASKKSSTGKSDFLGLILRGLLENAASIHRGVKSTNLAVVVDELESAYSAASIFLGSPARRKLKPSANNSLLPAHVDDGQVIFRAITDGVLSKRSLVKDQLANGGDPRSWYWFRYRLEHLKPG
jgi:hypothetical protein